MVENVKRALSTSDLTTFTTDHQFPVMGDDVYVVVHHHAMLFIQQGFHGGIRPLARHHSSGCHGFHGWHLLFCQAQVSTLIYYLLYALFSLPML